MKNLFLLLLTVLTFDIAQAQNKIEELSEYTASNDVTYKIGDEIKLGRGSDTNGKFVYVTIGGWAQSIEEEKNRIDASWSGRNVTLKKS